MCMICGFSLCSPITSFEFEDPRCHIYICHCYLGSTTKPKWEIARIRSQLHTLWRMPIICVCKEQYNVWTDKFEALHGLQYFCKSKDFSRIWGRKYSCHCHYSRKWYVISSILQLQRMNKTRIMHVHFYKSHIPCSSISSSESKGSKCHLYICHRHLGTTTKSKWDCKAMRSATHPKEEAQVLRSCGNTRRVSL